MNFKVSTDSDGMHESLQAEIGYDGVFCFIQNNAEYGKISWPSVFEHWSNCWNILNENKFVVLLVLLQHISTSTENAFSFLVKK